MDAEITTIKSVIELGTKKINNHKVTRLTAPGENYGSLMLKVDLEVVDDHRKEDLHLVAKMLPPTKFMQELFNTDVTFRNEVGFYKCVFPVLQEFQKECGVKEVIDFAPRYYGSRVNFDNDSVEEDAVLVLENLKVADFVTLDRIDGLGLEVAKLVLADLAQLHGVSLGLKLQKQEVFNREVKPFLQTWKCIPDHYQKLKKDLIRLVDNTDSLQPHKEKIIKEFDQQMVTKPPREPWATVTHNDCWTNNNMVKFDGYKPVKNKLVDYQVIDYGSPAKDVLFFIFTSVKTPIVAQHFDDLLKFYHDAFAGVLRGVGCDLSEFSYESFLQEIDFEARNSQFGHVAFMLFPVMAVKEHATDVDDMNAENIVPEEDSDLLREKFVFFVNEFVQRKWIFN